MKVDEGGMLAARAAIQPLPSPAYPVEMSFNKPFRAVPIRPGPRYRQPRRRKATNPIFLCMGGAALVGAALGIGSTTAGESGVAALADHLKPVAVSLGIVRARAPRAGDHWSGCNDARTAGTFPIYAGEPGYRQAMDGDHDGIACEPYRGA